jgi:hypothetical protein
MMVLREFELKSERRVGNWQLAANAESTKLEL